MRSINMPPLRLLLVRHGQSQKNDAWGRAWGGNFEPIQHIRADPKPEIHLTPRGRTRTEQSAEWLDRRIKPRKIGFEYYRSDALRVQETAEILLPHVPPEKWHVDHDLRERDMGIVGTMLPLERKAYEKGLSERFTLSELYRLRPGEEMGKLTGESFADVELRLRAFVARIKQPCARKNVFILGHGATTWVMLALLENMTDEQFFHIYRERRREIRNGTILQYSSIDPRTGNHTGIINWMRMCTPWADEEFSEWRYLGKERETLFCD